MQLPAPFGKYELLERIATGGMAEVFLARSFGVAGFEKRLVIKRLRPELVEDPRFISMFIAEAKIGVHLNHPNVVQVYELGKVASAHYIAMEHLHGKDLTRIVKMLRAKEAQMGAALAVAIVAEVCRGMSYAHGRTDADGTPLELVHRDVSPHNVIVTFTGEVKLVDFGIARLAATIKGNTEGDAKKPGPGGGKYAYMSPEQADGQPLDHRSDLFSAGIVLWELIVGQRLYQDRDPGEKLRRVREAHITHPSEYGVEIDEGLWTILRKALARDPNERYAAAALFEEDLRAWLFERRHRVGRAEIAALVREAFPADADRPGDDLQLRQLVADVDRLEHTDRTGSDPVTGRTPLPGKLKPPLGERRPVVVVMVDVDGLTELSATVEPETLVRRKYQLLRWARRIVDRHGGMVQRAVDDHITILFGVPRSRTDDLAHALECALELHRNVTQLRKKGMTVELAIGVHTGEVTVSQAGRRIRYVARGDTTRLARRLSAVADHGQTLVSERVLSAVEGWFRVRYGPNIPSRGGRNDLPSYLVEGRAHGLRGSQSGAWLRRGNELDVLRSALIRLAEGQGTSLSLVGGMGCGKSRFIREIRELATRRSTTFLGVRCTALGTERPLEPIRDIVASVLCGDPDAPLDTLIQETARLPQLGLSERDVGAILALIGGKAAPTPERGEIWQAVGRMLRGLAADRRLIVAFDDAQHLPSAWLPELAHLVRSLADAPVLFLLGITGEKLPSELDGLAQIVRLGALPKELQIRFVESRLRVEQIDLSLSALIERSCEGNPLYIEEMLKYLIGASRITIDSGRAVLTGADAAGLPHTLQSLITARIDALDAACRGLLQLAAVVGETFDEALITEAAGIADPAPWLIDLVSHGLVVREPKNPEQWSFSSALVREAALRGTLGVQRRDYHRLIAAGIEHIYKDNLDSHLEALVTHCAEGGRKVDAARYAFQVGHRYEREQYLEAAKASYQQGLQHIAAAERNPDEWDARIQGEAMLNLRLGVVMLLLGDLQEGHRRLVLSLDIASETGLPWIESRVHVALGRSHLAEGKIDLAAAHLSQAQEALRIEPDAEVEREAVETRALLVFEQGRNEESEQLWQRALMLSEDDPAARARCEIGLATRYLRSGEHNRARELLEHALVTARSSRDRIIEGRVLNNIGLVHSWAGRHAMALHYYRAALELREGIGYTRGVVVNHHNIGDVHFQSGEYAKAWVSFQRSRELAEEIGWERGIALNDVFLAFLDARQGRADSDAILAATARARAFGDHEIVVTGLWLVGRHFVDRGRSDLAETYFNQGLAEARRVSFEPMIWVLEQNLRDLEDKDKATAPP